MKNISRIGSIKRNQKTSLIRREVGRLLAQASLDYPELRGIILTRVELSADKSIAKILLYTPDGAATFTKKLEFLKLFAPSLRKALATAISGRYAPQVRFVFDKTFEKQAHIEALLDKISSEFPS